MSLDRVITKTQRYTYMKFTLDRSCEAVECKRIITEHMKALFGEVGASKPYDLVQYSSQDGGVLRVPSDWSVEVRAAIMLDSNIRIQKVSSSALSLTANSRTYQHVKQKINNRSTRKRKRSS